MYETLYCADVNLSDFRIITEIFQCISFGAIHLYLSRAWTLRVEDITTRYRS